VCRNKTWNFEIREFSECVRGRYYAGFSSAMRREVERAGGTDALRESSEAFLGEFAQENEVLTPENTMPWQKFAKTAET
jgi:hypothetical protein